MSLWLGVVDLPDHLQGPLGAAIWAWSGVQKEEAHSGEFEAFSFILLSADLLYLLLCTDLSGWQRR